VTSAYRALACAVESQLTPAASAGVEQPQRITLRFHAAEQRDRLQRLQRSHHPDHRAGNACRAAVALRLGVVRPQAAVTALRPRRRQDHHLPAKTDGAGGDKRRIVRDAGGVNRLARRHIVSAVEHDVSQRNLALQAVTAEARLKRDEFDIRVELMQPLAGNICLRLAHIRRIKQDLPLQIADVNIIVIRQHQRTDACARQIKRSRRA